MARTRQWWNAKLAKPAKTFWLSGLSGLCVLIPVVALAAPPCGRWPSMARAEAVRPALVAADVPGAHRSRRVRRCPVAGSTCRDNQRCGRRDAVARCICGSAGADKDRRRILKSCRDVSDDKLVKQVPEQLTRGMSRAGKPALQGLRRTQAASTDTGRTHRRSAGTEAADCTAAIMIESTPWRSRATRPRASLGPAGTRPRRGSTRRCASKTTPIVAGPHRPASEQHDARGARCGRRHQLQRVSALQPVSSGDRLRPGTSDDDCGRDDRHGPRARTASGGAADSGASGARRGVPTLAGSYDDEPLAAQTARPRAASDRADCLRDQHAGAHRGDRS